MTRSTKAEVRNPVLTLPAFKALAELPAEVRGPLCDLLADLASDARGRAETCWRTHKAPMAAYWKAVSVYAGHIRRAIQPGRMHVTRSDGRVVEVSVPPRAPPQPRRINPASVPPARGAGYDGEGGGYSQF